MSTRHIYWISRDGNDNKLSRGDLQECHKKVLNLFRIDLFGAAQRYAGVKGSPS